MSAHHFHHRKNSIIRYTLALLLLCYSNVAQAASPCLPYEGEQLTFSVGWEFINAGSATMLVSSPKEGAYRIVTQAQTNKFLDLFKKVRDSITSEGRCKGDQPQSTLFLLEQQERDYRAIKKTVFDWKNKKVFYTENKKQDQYDLPAAHDNVMDAFFKVRTMNLTLGQVIHLPIFDSRKFYDVTVNIGEKTKKLKAPWGKTVECISIEPLLKTEGIFSSPGEMKIWVTNDARHIPIKLVAKIKIGSIIGHLTHYQEPK